MKKEIKNKQVVSTLLTVSMAASLFAPPAMALEQEQSTANRIPETISIKHDTQADDKTIQADETKNAVEEQTKTVQEQEKPVEAQEEYAQEPKKNIEEQAESAQEQKEPLEKQEEPALEQEELSAETVTEEMSFPADTFSELNNQDLQELYLQKLFYRNNRISLFVKRHGNALLQGDANALAIYTILKEKIQSVAENGGSTHFENISLTTPIPPEGSELPEKLKKSIQNAIVCLRVDIPEYIYWMDFSRGYSIGGKTNGSNITSVSITLPVAKPYQDNGSDTDVNSQMQNAIQARINAQKYATEIQGKTSLNTREKIRAIKDKICSLTAYNFKSNGTPADPSTTDDPWSDPWQMIWVFDNDTANKVVCEGYSKAFQYLFNLVFEGDPSVDCYCVTGKMDGGNHMWNIVQMDGQNYLVDVTNCDNSYTSADGNSYSNNSGWFVNARGEQDRVTGAEPSARVAGDGLFMLSTRGQLTSDGTYGTIVTVQGDVDNGYRIRPSQNSNEILYAYDDETKTLHQGSGVLDLTFVEKKPSVTKNPEAVTGLTYDGESHTLVTAGQVTNGKMQYRLDETEPFTDNIPQAVNAGTYKVSYKVAENDTATSANNFVTVMIAPADYTFDNTNSAITSISTTRNKGTAMPETNLAAKAKGVKQETVNGKLEWFTDKNCQLPATGHFDTAGTTTLYWKFTPDANERNYKSNPKTDSVTFTVQNTTPTEKSNHDPISVSGAAQAGAEGSIDLSQYLPDGAKLALDAATDTHSILNGTPTLQGNILHYSLNANAIEGESASIPVTVTNCTNYNDFVITITITVTGKEAQNDFHFAQATVHKTYSDADFTITALGNASTGAVTYESDAVGIATVDKMSGKVSIVKDGTVKITATCAADERYAEAKASYTLKIAKGTITITAKDKSVTTGSQLPTLTKDDYTVTGLKFGETLKTLPQIQYEGTPDTATAGSTPIVVSGAEKPELTASCYNEILYQNGTLTITRPSSRNGGSRSSGSTSASSNKTEATTKSDGTKVETITKSDGTKVETAKRPDGTVSIIETKKNGTVVETETTKAGDKTVTKTESDGSSVTNVKKADGTTATTTIDKNGQAKAEVNLSDKAIGQAKKENTPVSIPVPAVKVTKSSETAPIVTIKTKSTEKVDITIPVKNPTDGTVAVIVHPDGTEEIIRKSVADQNSMTLPLENGVSIKILDNSKTFADTQTHWAENAIDFVTSHELYSGTSENTFSPNTLMTRGMLVMVLHNLENNPAASQVVQFNDVKADTWYTNAIQWAASKNIVSGYTNGKFGPNDTITREQLAVILYRYAGSPTNNQHALQFTDARNVSTYAKEAMQWAVEAGIISGTDNHTLQPQANATRAETAAMLMRLVHAKI